MNGSIQVKSAMCVTNVTKHSGQQLTYKDIKEDIAEIGLKFVRSVQRVSKQKMN